MWTLMGRADLEDLGEPKPPVWKRPVPIAGVALVLVIILNVTFG